MVETTIILKGIECPRYEQSYFFSFPSVSSKKNTEHKNIHENLKFQRKKVKYFSKFYFGNFLKMPSVTLCSKAFKIKYNHQFGSICEIVGEDKFSVVPPKGLYFLSKSFSLHFIEKLLKQTMFGTS